MRHALLVVMLPALAAAVLAVACSEDSPSVEGTDDGGAVLPPDAEPAIPDDAGAAGPQLGTGLPCDVEGILENRCVACHGGAAGPPPLVDYDDLTAPSSNHPGKTMAEAAVEEMKAKTMPPTPAVPPEPDEIASFEQWVADGAPRNPAACGDALADGGAPVGDDGGVRCTSGKLWEKGDEGSPLMNPGEACNACHQQKGGPNLRIGGTVYPTLHEPNDCIGSAPPPQVRVIVTDSRKRKFEMEVNASGNFLMERGQRPRPPLRAVVVSGAKTRRMNGSVASSDCNSCHTADGAKGAPGRIMAP